MRLNRFAATAAMAGAFGSAALGIGAGIAQADPHGPNIPGPVCNGPGVNCNGPGHPLPPGQHGFPPPGHYNDPVGYGYPATWHNPPGDYPPGDYPVVFNPDVNQWGVFIDGRFVAYVG